MGDWYYIGHYGQLGPLTREQIDELVEGGVIVRDTYVWRAGMDNWLPAERVRELTDAFRAAQPFAAPPPPPTPGTRVAPPPQSPTFGSPAAAPAPTYSAPSFPSQDFAPLASQAAYYPTFGGLRSDRSRTAAGVLQLFLPGVGRMYLGYLAYGVLQLVLTIFTCGFLWLWSFIDGIIILTGGVKLDGYGRQLND
ncbi:DUF4339 domain-containing protein [bacterium]|nr:MAG: DUF4339 domain-containing protein [bacterium]